MRAVGLATISIVRPTRSVHRILKYYYEQAPGSGHRHSILFTARSRNCAGDQLIQRLSQAEGEEPAHDSGSYGVRADAISAGAARTEGYR